MSGNIRRNLAVQLTAGGANPLTMQVQGARPYTIGSAIRMALVAKGGTAPYAYSITGGNLPTTATFTASITTTVMTVTAVANGVITLGMPVTGSGVSPGQTVISFGTGTGGTGTYNMGISNTLTSRAMLGTILLNVATGIFSGTPSVAAAFSYSAQVTDAVAATFKLSAEAPISHYLQPVAVTPTPIEDSLLMAYSYTFKVKGAVGAVTWALTSGSLPPALSLSAGGVMSGTPAGVAGTTYSFVVTATDGGAPFDALPISVSMTGISAVNLNALAVDPLVVGINYSTIPSSTNAIGGQLAYLGVPPYTYTYSQTSGPAQTWIKYNKAGNGYMSGTPDAATVPGTPIVINVVVTDAAGVQNNLSYSIAVVNPNTKIQPQQSGSNVGTAGPGTLNFTGVGVTVTNASGTATVNIPDGPVITTITTSVTIAAARLNIVNVNAAALTPLLPATPLAGDRVQFVCMAACTSLSVDGNGNSILGKGQMVCDLFKLNNAVINFTLVYNATEGWLVA